jgi:hypothetical protein
MDACGARGEPGVYPVAATVLGGGSCARLYRGIGETGQPSINAQSPSERWDGDCAWSYSIPIRFDFISWTPKITDLAGSGSRLAAAGPLPSGRRSTV